MNGYTAFRIYKQLIDENKFAEARQFKKEWHHN